MDTKTIKRKIKESGLKKEYIAKMLNIHEVSLNNKLSNRSEFRVSEFNALCEVLKISDVEKLVIMRD